MKRKSLILFIFIISMFMIFPYGVKADDDCNIKISTDDTGWNVTAICESPIKSYGVFELAEFDVWNVEKQVEEKAIKEIEIYNAELTGDEKMLGFSNDRIDSNKLTSKDSYLFVEIELKSGKKKRSQNFKIDKNKNVVDDNGDIIDKHEESNNSNNNVSCNDELIEKVVVIISFVLKLIQIAVPIILIIMSSIDLVKAIVAGKEEEIKKSEISAVRRLIAAVIVFLVPFIISTLLGFIGAKTWADCWNANKDKKISDVVDNFK